MIDKLKPISDEQIAIIQEQAQNLRYGSLILVFQDGKLIQIEKTNKIRLERK